MPGLSIKDRWIYSLYARRGRSGKTPFRLSEVLKRPGRLLVCLPSDPEEARKAVDIIPDLTTCLGAEIVYVAGEPDSLACCDLADDQYKTVVLDPAARRWSGLPPSEIVKRLSKEGLSLAVDLNPRAELMSAVLCQKIDAPACLSMDDPRRGRSFSIRVRLADEQEASEDAADPDNPPGPKQPARRPTASASSVDDSPYMRMLRVIRDISGHGPDPLIPT